MGEVLLELTSSQHRDYCRNDRWEQGDRLLYLCPYLAGKLTITVRSPAGGRQITQGWSTGNWPISRHRPEIDGTPGSHQQEPWRWPPDRAPEKWPFGAYSGRWPYGRPPVIGRWSLTQLSERFKVIKIGRQPTDVANLEIRQKSYGHCRILVLLGRRLYISPRISEHMFKDIRTYAYLIVFGFHRVIVTYQWLLATWYLFSDCVCVWMCSVSKLLSQYMYNHYVGEGYDIASLLCPIPFHVRWNKIYLNQNICVCSLVSSGKDSALSFLSFFFRSCYWSQFNIEALCLLVSVWTEVLSGELTLSKWNYMGLELPKEWKCLPNTSTDLTNCTW